ncbi:hypothetical protein KFU94_45040 [Chloroflexi bacterium TSY]|nr:hypothetical protein [Chloroflexi bacterium TSY]
MAIAIAAHLILAYPSPQAAEKATYDEFQVFLKHKHNQPSKWLTCFDALTTQHPRSAPVLPKLVSSSPTTPTLAPYPQLQASNTPTVELSFLQHEDHPILLPCGRGALGSSLLVNLAKIAAASIPAWSRL